MPEINGTYNDEGSMVTMRNVFLHWNGVVSRGDDYYHVGVCTEEKGFFARAEDVVVLKEAVSFMGPYGGYYHRLTETLLLGAAVIDFVKRHPETPVLTNQRINGARGVNLAFSMLGEEALNWTELNSKKRPIYYVGRLYTPLVTTCFGGKPGQWLPIRERLIEKTIRKHVSEFQEYKQDLCILLIFRKEVGRSLVGFDEIFVRLSERFPGRVTIFMGDEGMAGTISKFANATIIVGVHGAGLSNVIFAPKSAVVIQIYPSLLGNKAYVGLCHGLNLTRETFKGTGRKFVRITIDIDLLMSRISHHADHFVH